MSVRWVQALNTNDDGTGTIVHVTDPHNESNAPEDSHPVWKYPQQTHHLYVGTYKWRKQLTVIADEVKYDHQRDHDDLGKRIASGPPDEMYQLMLDYARML